MRAIRLWKRTRGVDDPLLVSSLLNLSALYLETGQYGKAEHLGLSSLAERLGAAKPFTPEAAKLAVALGTLACVRGRYSESENYYREAMTIWDKISPNTQETVQTLNDMGVLYRRMGRNSDALRCYERALRIAGAVLRAAHPERIRLLANIGGLYFEMQAAKSEPFFREALAIGEGALGPDHPLLGQIMLNYSVVLQRTKRKAEAGELRKRAERILRSGDTTRYTVDVSDLMQRPGIR